MELRKTETEIASLSSFYESIRRGMSNVISTQSPSSDDDGKRVAILLPSLEENLAHIRTEKELMETETETETDADSQSKLEVAEETQDAETNPKLPKQSHSNNIQQQIEIKEYSFVNMKTALSDLESIFNSVKDLEDRVDRFRQRMGQKDPITKKPRYGTNTMSRVASVVDFHEALVQSMQILYTDNASENTITSDGTGSMHVLRQAAQLEDKALEMEESMKKVQADAEQNSVEARAQQEAQQKAAQQAQEEAKQEQERIELARRAEAARRARLEQEQRRIEEEQRAREAERAADRAFMDSIEKGEAGIMKQLQALRESCQSDPNAHSGAIDALHTIFSQISSKPEEIKFRKIRRDHPKFHEDIGRHSGGREFLVAAGFKLVTVDDVPCYFSKEPDIEHDMDGWSDWFNNIKRTLELIEEDMMK